MKRQRQSEMILRLLDAALDVEASVTIHGPGVARRLEERFAPRLAALEGGGKVDFLATLFALRDELAASREKLSADELRHIDLLDQITILSLEREDLFGSLQDDYTWLRGKLAKLGRKVVAVTGVQVPTAAGTAKLLRQVKVSVHLLSKPGLVLPPGRLGETAPDPEQIAARLEKKARRLRKVKRRLGRTRREAQRTRGEKNESVVRHRATLYPVCRTLEAFNAELGRVLAARRLVAGAAGFDWGWRDDEDGGDLDRMLWPVVLSAADVLSSDDHRYVRQCGGRDCELLFVDRSPGRHRRWCSVKRCGRRTWALEHYHREVKPRRQRRKRRDLRPEEPSD